MKNKIYRKLYLIIFITIFSSSLSYSQDFSTLYNYYKSKDFFHFRDGVKPFISLNISWQRAYLEALSDCTFGDFQNSKKNISLILTKYYKDIPDSLFKDLYYAKAIVHMNLYEYYEAAEACEQIKANYLKYFTKDELDSFNDDYDLFSGLKDCLPQTVTKNNDSKIKVEKDMAGMLNIPLKINGVDNKFIFDTGANFSVIVESEAIKLGMKILKKTVQVSTSTEEKTDAYLAIADSIFIGDIKIKNAAFYVLKDESLTFGPYKIIGVIGNPIIRAFGEVRISKDNELTIPLIPDSLSLGNLAMDGFTPIIQVICENDTLSFVFDSGANTSTLYEPYLLKNKSEIEGNYTLTDITMGGAGGMHTYKGYILDNIKLQIGNYSCILKKISLLAERPNFSDKNFYGKIGQDFIQQFDTVVYNNTNKYIEFIK